MAALITFRRTNLVGQERWKLLIPLGDCPCQSFYNIAAGGGNKGGAIIEAAKEPYKTLFAVAWATGMQAGEILALTRSDLDFERETIRVNKSSDDKTREIRTPKTRNSVALLPMPSALETMLRHYIEHTWKPNPQELLFPNRACTRPRKRESVMQFALKPLLLN